MIRRKTSERKAATQALQVIAESIRACRGRGGRPPASSPKLERMIQPTLEKSRSDIVKNIKTSNDEGKAYNHIVPMKTVLTRRDSQISQESMDSHSVSKALINKENLKPSQNSEINAQSNLKSDTKVALFIKDVDGLNHQNSVLKPSIQEIDLGKTQLSMCPPEPVDHKHFNKTRLNRQTSLTQLQIESIDQNSNSKTRKQLKRSGEKLEIVLKLKKSQSLVDSVVNPEKTTPVYDDILSQGSLLHDNPPQFLQKLQAQPHQTVVYEEEKQEVYPPQQNDLYMNNFYEPQKKDINQTILSKKNNFQEKTNKPEDTRNQHLIIKQTYLMHQNTQQIEVPTEKGQALLDNKMEVSSENAAAPAVLSSNKVDETLTQQNEGSSQIGGGQSGAGSSINEEDDDDITQTTGERQAQMQGGGGLSGSQGRWTDEEHDKFLEGMRLFGKDWRRIEEYIATRSCAQIRSHAQKYFNRLQRDLAKGIKRPDADQATILLGKKKRKHSAEGSKKGLQMPPQQSVSLVQQPPIKQLKTGGVEPSLIVAAPNSPKKESQTFNFGGLALASSTQSKQFETPVIAQPMTRQTNQQIQQINDALTKLVVPIEDQLVLQLQQLIGQREKISHELLGGRLPREVAGELLVELTNRFHSLAMQSLNQYKFDVCNRMIDERNLTQFVCILLSRQVIIEPNQASEQSGRDREIIQQVDFSPKRAEARKGQPFTASILNTSLQQQQLSSLQRNSYPQMPQVATNPYY